MVVYTQKHLRRLIKIDFVRFCIVGGTGFVINFILLVSLPKLFGIPVPAAQFVGAEIALFSNFIMHHKWTYKSKHVEKSITKLILQFHATTWPAIVGSTVMVSAGVDLLHLSKLVALAISSVIALLWNFVWSKFIIWRDVKPQEVKEISE